MRALLRALACAGMATAAATSHHTGPTILFIASVFMLAWSIEDGTWS